MFYVVGVSLYNQPSFSAHSAYTASQVKPRWIFVSSHKNHPEPMTDPLMYAIFVDPHNYHQEIPLLAVSIYIYIYHTYGSVMGWVMLGPKTGWVKKIWMGPAGPASTKCWDLWMFIPWQKIYLYTRWCPRSLAFSWFISPISLGLMNGGCIYTYCGL